MHGRMLLWRQFTVVCVIDFNRDLNLIDLVRIPRDSWRYGAPVFLIYEIDSDN